jgi:hypothetical protein
MAVAFAAGAAERAKPDAAATQEAMAASFLSFIFSLFYLLSIAG